MAEEEAEEPLVLLAQLIPHMVEMERKMIFAPGLVPIMLAAALVEAHL